ncbi:MAG: caffeoyl-CoA O-methyltransferase [Solirubrobacteraceae bacterium]|nr:caffeoyl-CoA O-methyltransferase [Solirubrobacteraceae bacterium]
MDIIATDIERYAADHTTPPDAHLAEVAAATQAQAPSPQMRSGLVEARLLEALVVAAGATRVLELGTFTGFGALSIAARLPEGGTVTTIEADEKAAEMARRHIEGSPDRDRVDFIVGDARELVTQLPGPWDLVFIDAWKRDYEHYYEAVLPKLAERGLIVCDNVLWSGQVLDAETDDETTRAMRAFNDHVQQDPRVRNTLLTAGDGLLLIWHSAP